MDYLQMKNLCTASKRCCEYMETARSWQQCWTFAAQMISESHLLIISFKHLFVITISHDFSHQLQPKRW